MFKVKAKEDLEKMGFTRKGDTRDYICVGTDEFGDKKVLFKVYFGSPYIRCSASTYASEGQLKLIHEWTKENYIEWED